MNSTKEGNLEILYDHYKDTFSYTREYLKERERLFAFVLGVIFLQFLQISFVDQYLEAFNIFVEKKLGFNFAFSKEFLNNFLWFILFSTSLRYFQINTLINRQYNYLHSLEDKLCQESGDKDFIRREGRMYLKKYPIFLNWVHFLYTWVFPVILIIVALIKVILEVALENKYSLSLFIGELFFIAICITTILYLVNIHTKVKNK